MEESCKFNTLLHRLLTISRSSSSERFKIKIIKSFYLLFSTAVVSICTKKPIKLLKRNQIYMIAGINDFFYLPKKGCINFQQHPQKFPLLRVFFFSTGIDIPYYLGPVFRCSFLYSDVFNFLLPSQESYLLMRERSDFNLPFFFDE